MTNTQPTARATDLSNWPPCSKCGTMMVLARIEPYTTGHDTRTFECPNCDHSEDAVVQF
jgi:DNA-directed RNA polymerase subunit M/transcription elongation factor TFIIS